MKKNIFVIITIFISLHLSLADIKDLSFGISPIPVKVDSIFKVFIKPKIPKMLLDSAGSHYNMIVFDMYVVSTIVVDKSHKITSIVNSPIYKVGNDLCEKNDVWKRVLSSFDSVSQYWEINEKYFEVDKHNFTNLSPGRKQYYFIIFRLHLPFTDLNYPDDILWIDIDYEK